MVKVQLVISSDKIGGSFEENNVMNTIIHDRYSFCEHSKSVVGDQLELICYIWLPYAHLYHNASLCEHSK